MGNLSGGRVPWRTVSTNPGGFEPHTLSAFLCLAPSGFPVPGLTERRHAAPRRALDSPHTIRYVGRTDRRSLCQPAGPGFGDFRMLGIEREHRRGVAFSQRQRQTSKGHPGPQASQALTPVTGR
jgi:hypothetical protein